jgi:hypothetical protein
LPKRSVNGLAAAENAMIDLPFDFVIGYNIVIIFHRLPLLKQSLSLLERWRWCLGQCSAGPSAMM